MGTPTSDWANGSRATKVGPFQFQMKGLMNCISRARLTMILFLGTFAPALLGADDPSLPIVSDVEWQPFSAGVQRIQEALEFLGAPLESRR